MQAGKRLQVGRSIKSTQRDEILIPFLAKYSRDFSKRTMARMLFEKYPHMFPSMDGARVALRYRLGVSGKDKRNELSATWKDFDEKINRAKSKWPEAVVENNWNPYEIIDLDGVYLILADTHLPFHSLKALLTAIEFAKTLGKELKGIILLGDIFDQYSTSWWPIDPQLLTLDKELRLGREFIRKLRDEFPRCKIVLKLANHENRFERAVMSIKPTLAASENVRSQLRFTKILCAEGNDDLLDGIDIVDPYNIMFHKELAILHGDELGKSMGTPVSAARTLFLRAKACAIQAHAHSSSSQCKSDVAGRQIITKSIGCLCNLHPKWKPLAHMDWNHGFGLLDTRRKWDIANYRIFDENKVVTA